MCAAGDRADTRLLCWRMQNPLPERQADRTVLLLAAMLAGLAMLGPFSIDTYMPSFPEIEQTFNVTPQQMQLTLSAYLATFSIMTLFHGAISDSFGRRRVILVNLAVFVAATIGCAVAQDFSQLLLFRALQGLAGGAGMVVGRAMPASTPIPPGTTACRAREKSEVDFPVDPFRKARLLVCCYLATI